MSNMNRKSVTSLIRTYGEVNPHAVVSYMQQYQQIEEEKGREEEEEIQKNASVIGDLGAGFVDNLKDFRVAQAGDYEGGFFKFMGEKPENISDFMSAGQEKISEATGRDKELLTAMFPKAKQKHFDRVDKRDVDMADKWGLKEDQKWSEMSFKEKRAKKKEIRDAKKSKESTKNTEEEAGNAKEVETVDSQDVETTNIEEPGNALETSNEEIELQGDNEVSDDEFFQTSSDEGYDGEDSEFSLDSDEYNGETLADDEIFQTSSDEGYGGSLDDSESIETDDGGDLGGGYTDDELEDMNKEFPWEEDSTEWDSRFDEDGVDGVSFDSGEFDEDLSDLGNIAGESSGLDNIKIDTDNINLDEVTKGVEKGAEKVIENVTEKFDFGSLFKNAFGFGG